MAEVSLGQLYEMNRSLVDKCKPMKSEAIQTKMNEIGAWLSSKPDVHHYFLVCRELSDYTVFRIIDSHYYEITKEMLETFVSKGLIMGIDYSHVYQYYEIWIRVNEDEEPYLFVLFDCDWMIVEA